MISRQFSYKVKGWATSHLREIRRDDGAVGKLAPGQGLQGCTRGIGVVVFDKDLANSGGLPAAATGPRYFHLEYLAVLFTFFFDVFADF